MIDLVFAGMLCLLSFLAGGVFYGSLVAIAVHKEHDPNWKRPPMKFLRRTW